MSEDKKSFTVSDRRHFTPEGEVRKSDADEAGPGTAPPSAPPEKPSAPTAATPVSSVIAGEGAPAPSASRLDEGEPSGPGQPGGEAGGRYPSDFLGLLISLGAQASMLLMGGPEGEPPDLEGARSLIELLSILKEKTEGHRTPQEDQLVEGLLYELRMAFVQATKAAGR